MPYKPTDFVRSINLAMGVAMGYAMVANAKTACAQSTPTSPPSMTATTPTGSSATPANALDVKLGYLDAYTTKKSTFSANVSFYGTPIIKSGTAPSITTLATQGLADVTSYSAYVTATNGETKYGGTQLSAFNTSSLPQKIGLTNFNLVLGVDAQVQSLSSTTFTFGIEHIGFNLAQVLPSSARAIGFLKFGFADERLSASDTSTATDQYGPTVRGLLGRRLWLGSYGKADTTSMTSLQTFGGNYQDLAKAVTLRSQYKQDTIGYSHVTVPTGKKIEDIKPAIRILMGSWDAFKLPDAPNPDDQSTWPTASQWAQAYAMAITTKPVKDYDPNVLVWADGNARQALGQFTGKSFREAYSFNLKYYYNPYDTNAPYVQVQYLDGYLEATPSTLSHSFVVLLGFSIK